MCRIILPDIPKANMQIILKFLYTGRLGVHVLNFFSSSPVDGQNQLVRLSREYYRGKYHCTVDLLFDCFGLVCFANKNQNCQLSYSWFQTSQTGGKWYCDNFPFSSIPWLIYDKFLGHSYDMALASMRITRKHNLPGTNTLAHFALHRWWRKKIVTTNLGITANVKNIVRELLVSMLWSVYLRRGLIS